MKQALIKHVPSSVVLEIWTIQKPAISRDITLPSSFMINVPEPAVTYKLCIMVYICVQGQAPQYLVDLCLPVSDIASRQHLSTSASRRLLVLPRHRLQTHGRRAFSVAGPSAWNLVPDNLRDPSVTRDSFCRLLKTYLFALYWSTQRIRGFTKMRYTNLLYLLTITSSKKVTRYYPALRTHVRNKLT